MVKTGIFHWYGYIEPFEERIRLIKESGFDYVMLWWEDEYHPRHIDKKDLIKIVESNDLIIDNIHLPYDRVNYLWSESSIRQNNVDDIKRQFNECRENGVETLVLHVSNGKNIELNKSSGFKSFNEIIKEAESIKLKVALENTQMNHYLDFILSEIQSDYAGLCYDSSHDFINGQSCGAILDKWKERLFCVHLSDCDGLDDRHWIAGKGLVDWSKIINIIKGSDCKSFSMEVYPDKEEKSLESKDFLLKARNEFLGLF